VPVRLGVAVIECRGSENSGDNLGYRTRVAAPANLALSNFGGAGARKNLPARRPRDRPAWFA
jgi:hypothetical protein